LTMQSLALPVTPLACAMWRYGPAPCELPGNGLPEAISVETLLPRCFVESSPKQTQTDIKIVGCSLTVQQQSTTRNPGPSLESKRVGSSARVADAPRPLNQRRQYESLDPLTGRVWGVPNSGGRGQCLDCPARSKPPLLRCQACQAMKEQQVHPPMSCEDLVALERIFGALAEKLGRIHINGRRAADAQRKLALLYSSLHAPCRISDVYQSMLRDLAEAAQHNNKLEAEKIVNQMVSQDWDTHKEWLGALKRLVSAM